MEAQTQPIGRKGFITRRMPAIVGMIVAVPFSAGAFAQQGGGAVGEPKP